VTATYRLQLHAGFTFADAARQLPYLHALGVTTVYLSPVLAAVPGSPHGYDVLDHGRINEELGGRAGLESLADQAHRRGLGVMVDVVPNHMAFVAPEYANAALWQVLEHGRDAATARWFDVDWDAAGGRLVVPVLGDDASALAAAGQLRVARRGGRPVVTYHDHVFPVAEGTWSDDVLSVLDRQRYTLVSWRRHSEINYRRFFDVSSLIAVRVEVPEVFDATHALLLELNRTGVVDAFRIDHPDGLADPEDYLRRLTEACRPHTPLYVEKILEGEERLPVSWPCHGTTGYDAARAVTHAFVDRSTLAVLDRTWSEAGGGSSFGQVADESKRLVVERVLVPETERLVRRAAEALPRQDPKRLHDAVTELLVSAEVYRAYADASPPEVSAYYQVMRSVFDRAERRRPDLVTELGELFEIATGPTDFAVRIQQTWGPVMAKGLEDTAFYRWHRLVALNEVGGDPAALEEAEPAVLHAWASWQEGHWPHGLTALSTHDTKRSEDVRARILAVAGDTDAWKRCSAAFAQAADGAGVDRPTAHHLWQILVGVGDIEVERLSQYLVKAAREAKLRSSWTEPDEEYEQRLTRLGATALADGPLRDTVQAALLANQQEIRATILGQKAVQLLLPGVPDVYQGCELVDLSLVDPDNRRPVDYDDRRRRLVSAGRREPADLDDEKLLVTSRLLQLRRELPDVFGEHGRYAPLENGPELTGPGAPVLGFLRGDRVACLATRPAHRGGWTTERVQLPQGRWTDAFTGRVFAADPNVVPCYDLFAELPVAVLVRDA
jgi:(1->4)-alpha-D-glucan 1-alpha-D-glucosylmutase